MFPFVEDGDYAEVSETSLTYVFSQGSWNPGTPAAYSNTFIELPDTPLTYKGSVGRAAVVNPEEDALIFVSTEGTGDMLVVVYDPQGINDDAFDVDNHTDGIINKVFSAEEKIKIDNHIAITDGNPHGTDKIDIGLGNVTNNAQIKKISSSVNGNLLEWDGITGDTVKDSGSSISDLEIFFTSFSIALG